MLSVGQTLASGNGGAGGEIALSCVTLTISSAADLTTTGGNGPAGVNGTLAGHTCCGTPPETIGATGGRGGQGGQGGVNSGCGSAGVLRKNGVTYSVTCATCPSVQGQQGQTLEACVGG